MLEALGKLLVVSTACKAVAIAHETHRNWVKKDEAYKTAVEERMAPQMALRKSRKESRLRKQRETFPRNGERIAELPDEFVGTKEEALELLEQGVEVWKEVCSTLFKERGAHNVKARKKGKSDRVFVSNVGNVIVSSRRDGHEDGVRGPGQHNWMHYKHLSNVPGSTLLFLSRT
jgi:hypothetical protein